MIDATKYRNSNLDLLRVLAAFAVVWLHISAGVVVSNPDVGNLSWWTGNVADAFSRWAVPVFVMISGALLLGRPASEPPIAFYRRRASRLLIPLVSWTILYLVFRGFTEARFEFMHAMNDLIKGTPHYHLWYIYMVAGLYFAAPYLQSLVHSIDERSLGLLISCWFAIAAIDSILGSSRATFLTSFIAYIGYFLSGHYFSRTKNTKSKLLVYVIIFCGVTIAIGTGVLLPKMGPRSWELMYDNFNPLVVIMSLSMFVLINEKDMANLVLHRVAYLLAPLTLGIYLVHPLWIWMLERYVFWRFSINPIVGIPIATLVTFAISALTVMLLIKTPFLKRTV